MMGPGGNGDFSEWQEEELVCWRSVNLGGDSQVERLCR